MEKMKVTNKITTINELKEACSQIILNNGPCEEREVSITIQDNALLITPEYGCNETGLHMKRGKHDNEEIMFNIRIPEDELKDIQEYEDYYLDAETVLDLCDIMKLLKENIEFIKTII